MPEHCLGLLFVAYYRADLTQQLEKLYSSLVIIHSWAIVTGVYKCLSFVLRIACRMCTQENNPWPQTIQWRQFMSLLTDLLRVGWVHFHLEMPVSRALLYFVPRKFLYHIQALSKDEIWLYIMPERESDTLLNRLKQCTAVCFKPMYGNENWAATGSTISVVHLYPFSGWAGGDTHEFSENFYTNSCKTDFSWKCRRTHPPVSMLPTESRS